MHYIRTPEDRLTGESLPKPYDMSCRFCAKSRLNVRFEGRNVRFFRFNVRFFAAFEGAADMQCPVLHPGRKGKPAQDGVRNGFLYPYNRFLKALLLLQTISHPQYS